jgi:hypothetical protein
MDFYWDRIILSILLLFAVVAGLYYICSFFHNSEKLFYISLAVWSWWNVSKGIVFSVTEGENFLLSILSVAVSTIPIAVPVSLVVASLFLTFKG